jgi:hypothetical protein
MQIAISYRYAHLEKHNEKTVHSLNFPVLYLCTFAVVYDMPV